MSKVEVNEITQQCGTTLTVGGGACKTAVVDATTVTLGRCGGTVSLASGATQSGFGRTGTVDWVTTVKVTGDSPITAVTGEGYFLDTTAGAITINLPAGAAGSIVSMADYARTWDTNAVTVNANGSEKIGGVASIPANLSTEGQSVTFVYIDGTQGWVNVQDSTSAVQGAYKFVVATGGTPCTGVICGNYKTHTFTGPGTFCVSSAGAPGGSTTVDYLVVAGGGGGRESATAANGGGGGGGGYRESPGAASGCYTTSPLGAAPAVALPVSVQGYTVTVGAGAAAAGAGTGGGPAGNGSDSTFSTIDSAGGGGGGAGQAGRTRDGAAGGSGGGAAGGGGAGNSGGAGNTPPTNPAQGLSGGNSSPPSGGDTGGGGGGGATEAGATATPCATGGGRGGAGTTTCITASPIAYSGGAGSSCGAASPCGTGGAGGNNSAPTRDGDTNKGGGGGGSKCNVSSGAGGSGVVIIRYKFQ